MCDVAAQLFDALAIIGIAMHAGMQAEALRIGAQHITRAMRFAQLTTDIASIPDGKQLIPCVCLQLPYRHNSRGEFLGQ